MIIIPAIILFSDKITHRIPCTTQPNIKTVAGGRCLTEAAEISGLHYRPFWSNNLHFLVLFVGWESHETRRSKLQLIVLYKIVYGLVDIPPADYLVQGNSRTRAAHKHKYRQYDCFKYSFFPRTIPLWIRLPAATAEALSLASFKRELSTLTL